MDARAWTRRLGLRGTGEHVPPLQYVLRESLVRLADRAELFLTRGMYAPYRPIEHRAFMRRTPISMHTDYVLHAATELVCREIERRGVVGDVAELGVANARWARTANRCLPDRRIHLFDTFTGWDDRDLAADAAAGLSGDAPYPMGDTSVAHARSVLPHPEMADFRIGWFPETAADLDDLRFALVHIDVGLMAATLAGLRWFHPRLAPGGTLIVEDYNNRHAPGVRAAVDAYLRDVPSVTTVWPNVGGAIVFLAGPTVEAPPR